MCRRGETVLAAAIFLLQDTILEYHLSAASGEGQRSGAMALLLHEAGSFGQRSGCRVLHLGGGTDRRPENSLLFFKAGFSERRAAFKTGRCVHRPEVYESMKTEWEGRRREAARRVLFYRD
jgi:lipid II:glycine glycyltransferase (peptidoglycan interpeptide bridge formation enzyme)